MAAQGIEIHWMGHSTFVLTSLEGSRILADPRLAGNPACPPAQMTRGVWTST